MSAKLADVVADHFEPAAYNSIQPRDSALQWSPTLEIMRQGVAWHGAGVASTVRQHQAVADAQAALYPRGHRLTERRVWQAADAPTVFMEWRSEGERWDGREVRNGGLTIFDFEGDAVQEMRVFTNTSYLEAVERRWAERLPFDLLLSLPAYHTLDLAPIEWKPHPPSRQAYRLGGRMPEFERPSNLLQKFILHQTPGLSYFDIPPDQRIEVSPQGYTEFQGTAWYLAGRNDHTAINNPNGDAPVGVAQRALFSPPGGQKPRAALSHSMAWSALGDPRIILNEWISDRITCTGRIFRNHGATVYSFDEQGRRVGLREYCNVAYLEAIHVEADVRGKMGEAFARLPAAATWDMPSEEWQVKPIPAF